MSFFWEPKLKEELPQAPLMLPDMIWQYLYVQGVRTSEEIDRLFSPTLKQLTHPMKILNMNKLVQRLVQAMKNNEKICIYGDFDLDGTSGVVLLLDGLRALGFENLGYYQPKRISEGYGLHATAIEKLKEEQSIDLILTVDVGISDIQAAQKALDLGIDLLITDHHLPPDELPKAFTIVNPNQKGCSSGLGYLCGTGVAFFVILALKLELENLGLLKDKKFNPKDLLDYFTIATLTDLVPLVKENRVLIKHGLKQIQKTKNIGLKALLDYLNLSEKKELTSSDIAFRFAPKLNALSRLELDLLPIDIYLAKDEKDAKIRIKKMIQINEKRIRLQKAAEQEAERFVMKNGLEDFILVCSENFHKGIVGLVATKLTQKYNVPVFVGAINEEGQVTGSSRMPKGMNLNLLKALESAAPSLEKFGGHAPAAGFLLSKEKIEDMRQYLKKYFLKLKNEVASKEEVKILFDAQGSLSEINDQFMHWYEQLGPFGSEFEIPVFKSSNLVLSQLRKLKGGHLKLTLKEPDSGKSLDGLWFEPPQNHPVVDISEIENHVKKRLNVLYEPQWNYFNGRKSIQILIKDVMWA